jgi:hypothetical protein
MNQDLQTLTPDPDPNHRRKGKIARLPKTTRDEINQMILDGASYPDILRHFGERAPGLTDANLSNWKSGGYQDWLRHRLRIEYLQTKHELAIDILHECTGATIYDASRQIVAAQLCELMLDFDPVLLLEHLSQHPQLYPRLINGLARLSEGELACSRSRAQEALFKARLAREQSPNAPNVLTAETLKIAQEKLNLR